MANRKGLIIALAASLCLAGAAQAEAPRHLQQALRAPDRPAADVARDAARKPAELLALAEVSPGDRVVDFVMGGGYFTRILSAAVGPTGQVVAYQPAEFIRFQASYGEALKAAAAAHANVRPVDHAFGALALPDGLDAVISVQGYHDMHLKAFAPDTAGKVNAEVFRALKPGGVYLVVDHRAKAGSGLEAASSLHRIDPALVRQEVEAAGFRLDAESDLLRDPADPLSANVFDPGIRGRTDQFILRFRKP